MNKISEKSLSNCSFMKKTSKPTRNKQKNCLKKSLKGCLLKDR